MLMNTTKNTIMFHGFHVQPKFWYGYDVDGTPVATSCWRCNNMVGCYVFTEDVWHLEWFEYNEFGQMLESYLLTLDEVESLPVISRRDAWCRFWEHAEPTFELFGIDAYNRCFKAPHIKHVAIHRY